MWAIYITIFKRGDCCIFCLLLKYLWKSQKINFKRYLQKGSTDRKSILCQFLLLASCFVTCKSRNELKIFWPVQISNQELWARAKQRTIELEIWQRKWGWLGCTLRRPPGDIAKAALEWNPQGTKPRGRPRTTWRRTIREEIRHQDKT